MPLALEFGSRYNRACDRISISLMKRPGFMMSYFQLMVYQFRICSCSANLHCYTLHPYAIIAGLVVSTLPENPGFIKNFSKKLFPREQNNLLSRKYPSRSRFEVSPRLKTPFRYHENLPQRNFFVVICPAGFHKALPPGRPSRKRTANE